MSRKTSPPPTPAHVAGDLRARSAELRSLAHQLLARSAELAEVAVRLEGGAS